MDEAGPILIRKVEVLSGGVTYSLVLLEEDLSSLYPGMIRYTVELKEKESILARFRTNSYEYSPTVPNEPRAVAERVMDRWEKELRSDPAGMLSSEHSKSPPRNEGDSADVVVIQGSPRPDGNCGILCSWVVEEAEMAGRSVAIIFPHDLDIKPCIGCYQCYNTGTCTFSDDMDGIIHAVSGCDLLVVCSPVYTNTVPAGLKAVIDRFQAFHAERSLGGSNKTQKGLLLGVAGRKGERNFLCVTRVVESFFLNLSMKPLSPFLVDRMDEVRDVRTMPELRARLASAVREGLERS